MNKFLILLPDLKVFQVSTRRAGLGEEAADALRRKSYSAGY
jgi:hypothetical protein